MHCFHLFGCCMHPQTCVVLRCPLETQGLCLCAVRPQPCPSEFLNSQLGGPWHELLHCLVWWPWSCWWNLLPPPCLSVLVSLRLHWLVLLPGAAFLEQHCSSLLLILDYNPQQTIDIFSLVLDTNWMGQLIQYFNKLLSFRKQMYLSNHISDQ